MSKINFIKRNAAAKKEVIGWVLALFCIAFIPDKAICQSSNQDGKIDIIQDPRIDSLLRRQTALNKNKKTIPGFRIQIYTGAQRNKANETRAEFSNMYADVNSYLIYQQPNFKVRVGDFRSRLDAHKFMRALPEAFTGSYIVNDEIVIPELDKK